MKLTRRGLTKGMAALAATGFGNANGASPVKAQSPPMQLATVLDGGFALPVSAASSGRDPSELRALLETAGHRTDAFATVLNVPVLRSDKGVVLFDCGAGKNFMPGTGNLIESLAARGIQPGDVSHVIFTHAHPDHLWGALDDFDTPAFPNATYHLPTAEWDDWFAADIYQRLPEDRHAFAAGAQRILRILDPVVRRFTPGHEPIPGILSIAAHGHTRGHCAFQVVADNTPTLIAGDAITHPVISFVRPDWAGGFDAEADKAAVTRKTLLERAVSDRLRLVAYHLPNGGIGQVERSGSAFRFVQR